MCKELAVVMDVAGTMLRMYRVAKDIEKGVILVNVVTWELIMEKKGGVAGCTSDGSRSHLILAAR